MSSKKTHARKKKIDYFKGAKNSEYENLLKLVLKEGKEKSDRTGTGILSIFGHQMRFDLSNGYIPVETTKKIYLKGVVGELIFFLKGMSNIKYLLDNNIHIWDEWATEDNELGPVYGVQWNAWKTSDGKFINQLADVIKKIKETPHSRRLLVSAWNVEYLPDETISSQENVKNGKQALPPCHTFFQFYVDGENRLSCQMYQRSSDLFLGLPFNITSYSLLTAMIAQVTGLKLGELILTIGDDHIYKNHIPQIHQQLNRTPYNYPKLKLNDKITDIFDFEIEDVEFLNYKHHPAIKGKIVI